MKLYTEEQLLNTVKAVLEYDNEVRIEKHLKALQPIELPSDEEIEEASKNIDRDGLSWENEFARDSFVECAKWMKEQILNQNKQNFCYSCGGDKGEHALFCQFCRLEH